jgi:hypothetical protein
MSEAITFNAKNIRAQDLGELLSASMMMLTGLAWRTTVVTDELVAEIDRMRNSVVRKMNPRIWEKYPGVWFTAKVTTAEVDAQEIIFIMLDDDLSSSAANRSFSMMETMEQPEEDPFYVSIVSLN